MVPNNALALLKQLAMTSRISKTTLSTLAENIFMLMMVTCLLGTAATFGSRTHLSTASAVGGAASATQVLQAVRLSFVQPYVMGWTKASTPLRGMLHRFRVSIRTQRIPTAQFSMEPRLKSPLLP